MTLSGHLRELRTRLLVCLGVLIICMAAGIHFAPRFLGVFLRLGEPYHYQFVYISPEELLMEYLTVDFAGALCLACPVILYEIWAFLRPGLNRKERILIFSVLFFGLLFAFLGILFAYRILIPFMLRFFMSVGEGGMVRASISVRNYVSFLMTMFLVFAAVFELPVVAVLLTQFRVLNAGAMKRIRKAVVPAIFLVAAVITPPDVVSQIMVAIPLLLLYELSIWLCTGLEKIQHRSRNE